MVIKLKANKPNKFKSWIISVKPEKLYAQRFQGKPVKILALIKSEKARPADKINKELKLLFKTGPIKSNKIEKNKLRNKGIKIKPIGIKNLNVSSKVNELTIQCIPLK